MPRSAEELAALLEKEGIVELDKDIRGLRRSELKRYFGSSTSKRIILSKLIKSLIWQAYTRIKEGTEAPITGNLRTFWYRFLKPALAKVPKKYLGKSDPYDAMSKLFMELALELKLFSYRDFDFTDENWENRRLGTERPEVLVFAEKRGWVRILRRFHKEYGVSMLALGGYPSALTSSYTATDIKALLKEGQAVRLIGLVDFDPSGDLIALSFRRQLELAGLEVSELVTLIEPRHYSEEELDLYRYRLPKSQRAKTDAWLEKTGGVAGERYGLEAESMPVERLEELVKKAVLKLESD